MMSVAQWCVIRREAVMRTVVTTIMLAAALRLPHDRGCDPGRIPTKRS